MGSKYDKILGRVREKDASSAPGPGTGDMLKSENLSGLTDYAAARQNLGLEIGVDVEAQRGPDDNYVTDAEKTVIGNTSNTNSGDNATNSQYSGLNAAKVPYSGAASDVDLNAHKITGLGDPTLAQDAVTKNYVDGMTSGGVKSWFFTKDASDVSGMYQATLTSGGSLQTIVNTVGDGTTLLATFISTQLSTSHSVLNGSRFVYLSAHVSSVAKGIQLYLNSYISDLDGTNQVLASTFPLSSLLTLATSQHTISVVGDYRVVPATKRIVYKVYAVKEVGGPTIDVTLSVNDATYSRYDVPSPVGVTDLSGVIPVSQNTLTKEPTGFDIPEDVVINYDPTTQKVTLSGTTWKAYYNGTQISSLVNGYVSIAHTNTTGHTYFYYYNGTSFAWSTDSFPGYDKVLIAKVIYGAVDKYGIRECHGLMQWQTHKALHTNTGTVVSSGGTIPSSSYVLSSTTAANRRPNIDQTVLLDEDLLSTNPALTSKLYNLVSLTSTGITNYSLDQADIIRSLVNNPYYNSFNTPNWGQTLMPSNSVATIWVYSQPTTASVTSQKYRYLFVQPQWITQAASSSAANLLSALNTENSRSPSEVNLGSLATEQDEIVCIGRIAIIFTTDWTLRSVTNVRGSKYSQIGTPAGNFLSSVVTDTTLTGAGTPDSPLSVVPVSSGGGVWKDIPGTPSVDTTYALSILGSLIPYLGKGLIIKWTESGVVKKAMVNKHMYMGSTNIFDIVGDPCLSIDTGSLKYASVFATEHLIVVAGFISSTAANVGNIMPITTTRTFFGVDVSSLATTATGGSTVVDINQNGTSMMTTKASLWYAGLVTDNTYTFNTAIQSYVGEQISLDIDSVCTGGSHQDLYVKVYSCPSLLFNMA